MQDGQSPSDAGSAPDAVSADPSGHEPGLPARATQVTRNTDASLAGGPRDGNCAISDGGYTTLSSRVAYENRWLRVREDIIRRPDGSDGLYGVIERDDFVVVVAMNGTGTGRCLTLVEQFRYPVGQRLWELPMGMWEERPDATPAQIAAGELAEETGLVAASMLHVGTLFQGAGYSNQKGHLFLATGLGRTATDREATEQDMVAKAFPLSEVEAMIGDGRISCMVTIAAIGLMRIKGFV